MTVNPPWNQYFFLLYAPGKHLPLFFELYFLYKLALQNFQVQEQLAWTKNGRGEGEEAREKIHFPGLLKD